MAQKATIIVPHDGTGSVVAKTVATELANEYGGSSMYELSGYWDDGSLLVTDDSTAVYTIADDIEESRIKEIAEWVKETNGEDAVMYTIEEIGTVGYA